MDFENLKKLLLDLLKNMWYTYAKQPKNLVVEGH